MHAPGIFLGQPQKCILNQAIDGVCLVTALDLLHLQCLLVHFHPSSLATSSPIDFLGSDVCLLSCHAICHSCYAPMDTPRDGLFYVLSSVHLC